jgi:patatin-related protein
MRQEAREERSREVRIGLVMYGGVSLAIYMNGIANELFRAVRGRGVYRLFKQLTDSDVVVDVVSGASAGGINGMFLAFALCNELEFDRCADLWRLQGGINDLLRDPTDEGTRQTSLLDSEGYYEPQLAGAFEAMWNAPIARRAQDAASRVDELDLFVAGTDFNGRRRTAVDSAAHAIELKDHRARFWLKHRAERKTQLDPRANALGRDAGATRGLEAAAEGVPRTGLDALARLARITSCFPGAFAHVKVDVPDSAPKGDGVDGATSDDPEQAIGRKLGVWGNLPPNTYYFLDGGILDNKPFTSTIEAIFYRMANRPVQRHLLYVEPDPERFQKKPPRVPSFLTSAIDSLTSLPAYESIAGDLQEIAKHNDSIERYTRTCDVLRDLVMDDTPGAAQPSAARPGSGKESREASAVYANARLQSLVALAAEGLLDIQPGKEAAADDRCKDRMKALRHALDDELSKAGTKKGKPVNVCQALFDSYDVQFRVRRLMHLTYVLMRPVRHPSRSGVRQQKPKGVPTPAQCLKFQDTREALIEVGHRVALLEIVRAKLLRAVERSASDWRALDAEKVWGRLLTRLDAVLGVNGLPDPVLAALSSGASCEEQLSTLSAALELRTCPDYVPPADPGASLLSLVDVGEKKLIESFDRFEVSAAWTMSEPPIQREYERFDALDQVLFPIQFVSDLYEQDIIRTVRVSPLDAQRGCSKGAFADKVTGETLGHFGAFLKRSWRTNDILYGRLDGSCQLIETLLNPSWLLTAMERPEQRISILESFGVHGPDQQHGGRRTAALERWLIDNQVFPKAGTEAVTRAAHALGDLLEPSASAEQFAARTRDDHHDYKELLDALVEATHFTILQEDYHKLITDAVEEQLDWQSVKLHPPTPTESDEEAPASERMLRVETRTFERPLDNLAVKAAARQFAADAGVGKKSSRELAELLGASPVGKEKPEQDIPLSVLIELAARSLLILRNCIVNSFGPERAAAVRGHRVYRVFIDWPLRGLHALAALISKRPVHGGVALGLIAYFLLAMAVDVCFFKVLHVQTGWRWYVAAGVFGLLPLICLFTATVLVAGTEYLWDAVQTRTRRVAKLALLAIAGSVVLVPGALLAYLAYAYVLLALNPPLVRVLSRWWWPEAFDRPGDVVVLAVIAALGFWLGKRTRRRAGAQRPAKPPVGHDPKDGPPGSSQRGGAGAGLPVAAE